MATHHKISKRDEYILVGLIVAFLLWCLWHFLKTPAQSSAGNSEALPPFPAMAGLSPAGTVAPITINGPAKIPADEGCCCGPPSSSCSNNASRISSLNEIYSIGAQWQNATIDAGNSTIKTLADMENKFDPFHNYVTVPAAAPVPSVQTSGNGVSYIAIDSGPLPSQSDMISMLIH